MTDIVQELREHHAAIGFDDKTETWLTAAADEIERLREEIDRKWASLPEVNSLRLSLYKIRTISDPNGVYQTPADELLAVIHRYAKAALGEGK